MKVVASAALLNRWTSALAAVARSLKEAKSFSIVTVQSGG